MKSQKTALILLLAAAFVTRFLLVLPATEGELAAPVSDDGFYNLTIARHLAQGHGFTFDGVVPTSGFHPPVVLVAAPCFALFGHDTVSALRAILLAHAVAGTLLGWVIYRITRRIAGRGPALGALLLFVTSPDPAIFGQTMNGCDTVFAALALMGTVWFYLARVRNETNPSRGRLLGLGLAMGAVCVARLDLALFAAFLVVDFLVLAWRRGTLRPGRPAVLAAGILAVVLPWMLLVFAQSGRLVPDNARAVRLISRATAGLEVSLGRVGLNRCLGGSGLLALGDAPTYADDDLPAEFYSTVAQHAGCELLKVVPHTGTGLNLVRLALIAAASGRAEGVGRFLQDSGMSYLLPQLLALGFALLLLVRRKRLRHVPELATVVFLLPAALLLFLAYALVIHGQWSFDRYLFPIALIALLFTPALARVVTERWTVWKTGLLVAGCMILFVAGSGNRLVDPQPSDYYRQAMRVAAHLPRDAVVGAAQAGHLAFFCPQSVVNLDGKVDPASYRALRDRRVLEQAHRRGVRFVTDWPFLVRALMVDRSGASPGIGLRRIEPPPGSRFTGNAFGFASYVLEPMSP